MKKSLMKVLTGSVAVGLILAFAGLTYGDDSKPADKGGHEKGAVGFILGMKDKLGLTGDQTDKLQALSDNEKKEMKPLFDQAAADLKTLVDKVKAGAKDDEIKAVLDTLSGDRQNIETARKKYTDSVRDILTPTQQAKIVIAMTRHDKWGNHKGKDKKDKGESDK